MQNDFESLAEFFGEDYTKTTTEDFFGSFVIFLQHIEVNNVHVNSVTFVDFFST